MSARNMVHVKFDSVVDAVDQVDLPWNVETNKERARRFFTYPHSNSLGWYGIDGGPEAVTRAMSEGFDSGAEKIDAMLSDISINLPPAVGIKRKLIRGMLGDELDIHAVNRGDLGRAWSSRKRMVKRGVSCVSIVADVCG